MNLVSSTAAPRPTSLAAPRDFVATPRRALLAVATLLVAAVGAAPASADPYPPNWNGGAGPAVHFSPVAWPADDGDGELDYGDWTPYLQQDEDSEDQSVQDPSNGGTSPQNYANVSSGCTDLTLPSIFWAFDDDTLFFRWRVEQIANSYATGPSAGTAGSTDPWKSALWTVFLDIDGDGYREFAFHIDGSSGAPGTQIDRLVSIYSNTPSQSIDYVNDPQVCQLFHNPSAFVDGPSDSNTGRLLNFQNSLSPTASWPNGAAEAVWDYGTTRARKVTHYNVLGDPGSGVDCEEYFVDYQIPLAMLDATASSCAGPAVDENTPMSLAFATANSLNDPLQKDVVFQGSFTTDPDDPIPGGNPITPGGGTTPVQPMVTAIGSAGCGPATLSATVMDSLTVSGGVVTDTITSVDFYSYRDTNGNGLADDGNSWTLAAAGSATATLGQWTASWDSSSLSSGLFLLGVRAQDDSGNITWSHLTQAEVNSLIGATPPNYPNPLPSPGVVTAQFVNTCGTSPALVKTAPVSEVAAGGTVDFTLTVSADTLQALSLTSLTDALPSGWTYVSNQGGTLTPVTSPVGGASGNVTWTFAPQVIPAGESRTLVFRAQAPTAAGSYTNEASASTSQGTLESNRVPIAVGAPRLTISKSVSPTSATPGDALTYTITYSNDSPVNVTGATITDALPIGLTFVSATGGGVHDGGSPGTVTWNVGDLDSGEGPYTVTLQATLDDPYLGAIPNVNTATITSNETAPEQDTASVFISQPFSVQKRSTTAQIAAGNTAASDVTYTIDFANTGGSSLATSTITDVVPTGWTFRSYACGSVTAPGGCATTSAPAIGGTGTVTWTISNLPAGGTGTVTLVLRPVSPYTGTHPSTNTAIFTSGANSASDSYNTAITQQPATCPTSTLFFHSTLIDEGVDTNNNVAAPPLVAGNQRSANTTAPTGATQTVAATFTSTQVEVARWYSDPVQGSPQAHDGPVTANIWVTKTNGPPATIEVAAYDYDPATGQTVAIGAVQAATANGNITTPVLVPFTFNATSILETGHRVLWIVRAVNANNNNSLTLTIHYDSALRNSRGTVCLSPVTQNLSKYASPIVAQPGDAVTFTIPLGNASRAATTGNVLTETLPAGMTFVSASASGGTVSQTSVNGQTRTFTVTSTGQAAGTLAAASTVTVTINATIDAGAAGGVLTNSATLTSNEADPVGDTAGVTVVLPLLEIEKAASDTLLPVGATTTYTLTIRNLGNAASTNVVVSDPLPAQTYYSYVGPCSTNAGSTGAAVVCTPSGSPTNSLGITVDRLDPGESVTVSYDMTVTQVSGTEPPAGLSEHPNTATGHDAYLGAGNPVSSNTVIVTISTNPNLQIDKSTTATSPIATGEVLTYTLAVSNSGSATAADVEVTDAIPASTSYVAGTLVYEGGARTDGTDGDNARFDAVGDEVVFDVGALGPGVTRTMSFQVVVDDVLSAGTTAISNVGVTTSTNAGQRSDTVDLTAEAAPEWSLLKSAPDQLPFPLTFLNGNQGATTTLNVDSTSMISIGDVIAVQGSSAVATVTALTATTVTVDSPLSGGNNAEVRPAIEYTVRYTNTGDAAASGVVITDALPAGTTFASASDGGVHDGGSPGTVTWTLAGPVAPGDVEIFDLVVVPSTTGTYLNDFVVSSNELADATSNTTTTSVGALVPAKSTSTPNVTNSPSGTTASYTLTVTNDSGTTATNVTLTDTFETGFSYASTTSTSGGTRTTTTNPTAGANPATWCCWTLADGATLTINLTAAINDQVGDGTYQNALVVSSDQVAALEFDELETTAEDVTVDYSGPNQVIVTWFEAYADGDDVVLRWETDAEVGTLGFRVLRLDPEKGVYLPVHDKLLPGLITAPQGGVYSLVDRGAARDAEASYLLVELEANGQEQRYGPMRVAVAPSRDDLGLPPGLAERKAGQRYSKVAHAPRPADAADALVLGKKKPRGDAPSGLRLGIAADGLYQVGAAEIASVLGLDPRDVQKRIQRGALLLTVDDQRVAWTDPDGSAQTIQFYAEAANSNYSRQRIYLLALAKGPTMASVAAAPGAAIAGQTFRDTRRFEVDTRPLVNGTLDAEGEIWFWDFLFGNAAAKTYPLALESPAAGGADAVLEVALQGASATGATTHRVTVSLNGQALGSVDLASYEYRVARFTVPASLLVAGNNQAALRAELRPGLGSSLVFLDRFAIEHDRTYRTAQPALAVTGGGYPNVTVEGLPTSGARVLDVTTPRLPKVLGGVAASSGANGHAVRFATAGTSRYFVATPGAVRQPSLAADYTSSLLSPRHDVDYLVIAPAALLEGAERLAELRRARGLTAMVVSLDDVMDEMNGGQLDPAALRDFLAWTQVEWDGAPRYVALVGEGHYDYLDTWTSGTNLMPPLLAAGSWGLYASDNRLADADGDGFPEAAVGRIPVTSAAQLDAYVDKLAAYEAAVAAGESWSGDVLVSADNPDSTGSYWADSDRLTAPLGDAVSDRLYLGALSTAEVNTRLMAGLQSGVGLVTYLGHGGLTTLAAEGILRSTDVPLMTNGARAPVMALMACHLGNFAIPGFPSLAEDLVLHGAGGAVAVWTPAGISYNPHRRDLAAAFLAGLQAGGTSPQALGDVVLQALVDGVSGRGPAGREIVESQVLLGDPATLVAPPAPSVQP